MGNLRINGSTSGYVELVAPAAAGTTSITLPSTNGTIAIETGAWYSWTPTLAQGATTNIAKTVNYAKYCKIGKTIIANFDITTTGTGTASAAITLTLPETAAYGGYRIIGNAAYFVASTVKYKLLAELNVSTTTVRFIYTSTGVDDVFGLSTPFTSAISSGQSFTGTFMYEAA